MRTFTATRGSLFRRGVLVASLSRLDGNAGKRGCQFGALIKGKTSYWVATGVALTIAWQVEPAQPKSAWLEADVVIREVTTAPEGLRVRMDGTTTCRPHRRPHRETK